MKTIKLNWGAGIAIVYLGFVAMITVLVVMSTSQKVDMVTSQYYAEELHFQDKIYKIQRAKALTDPLSWTMKTEQLQIRFPQSFQEKDLSGTIKLYCPSNDRYDRIFPIRTINHTQLIPLSAIPAGRYHVQIDWKNGRGTYWNEDVITILHTTEP